jgi:hypothetical protein
MDGQHDEVGPVDQTRSTAGAEPAANPPHIGNSTPAESGGAK